jgi:uridine kinase
MLYDCNVFHMDDFYLPRTADGGALRGTRGNVDRERFFEEVLLPLSLGRPVLYRPFDCRTFTIGEGEKIAPKPLNVIEGAYSMHPALADSYDFSVFLKIPPRLQRDRILERNAPEEAKLFFERWIPLEERYFEGDADGGALRPANGG